MFKINSRHLISTAASARVVSAKVVSFVVLTSLGLTACGGGGSGFQAPTIANGVFKDSNVSGLSYVSGDTNGITNTAGAFRYEEGNNVAFSIGGVSLGEGLGKAVMTPIDLVAGGSLSSSEVINKARFLMMLDENNMPADGITISQKVQTKATSWTTVDFASEGFPSANVNSIIVDASVEDGVSHALPSVEDATAHLRTTLICASSGAFVGAYSGTESGNFAFVVNPVTGKVSGSSFATGQSPLEVVSVTDVDIANDFQFNSTEAGAKSYAGKITSSDDMSGTWVNSGDAAQSGNFTGTRLGGKNNAVTRYTVTFKSNSADKTGVYTFDVDSANNITGTSYDVATKAESGLTGSISDNELTVEAEDGTQITGFIDSNSSITGTWINRTSQTVGSLEGAGCRLN